MATAPVHHDLMIARVDKAAKDEAEAEELASRAIGNTDTQPTTDGERSV